MIYEKLNYDIEWIISILIVALFIISMLVLIIYFISYEEVETKEYTIELENGDIIDNKTNEKYLTSFNKKGEYKSKEINFNNKNIEYKKSNTSEWVGIYMGKVKKYNFNKSTKSGFSDIYLDISLNLILIFLTLVLAIKLPYFVSKFRYK